MTKQKKQPKQKQPKQINDLSSEELTLFVAEQYEQIAMCKDRLLEAMRVTKSRINNEKQLEKDD